MAGDQVVARSPGDAEDGVGLPEAHAVRQSPRQSAPGAELLGQDLVPQIGEDNTVRARGAQQPACSDPGQDGVGAELAGGTPHPDRPGPEASDRATTGRHAVDGHTVEDSHPGLVRHQHGQVVVGITAQPAGDQAFENDR